MRAPSLPRIQAERIRREGFRAFVRYAWPHVETSPFIDSWHIDAICQRLEVLTETGLGRNPDAPRNLVINVPPGSGKSLLVAVFWPAWVWAHVDARARFIFASYDDGLALRDARRTIELLTSDWGREAYGRIMAETSPAWGDHWTIKGGWRFSTSCPDGKLTGRHPDFLVVDDSIKPRDAYGGGQVAGGKLQAVSDWWHKTASTRRATRHTCRLVVGQRLTDWDLPGECIAEGYDTLIVPLEHDPDDTFLARYRHPMDPRTEPGETIMPGRFDPDTVVSLKRDLGADAAAQLQQTPKARTGETFKVIHTWGRTEGPDSAGVDCVALPGGFDRILTSWDLTFKGKPESDRVAWGVWGVKGLSCYLLDFGAEILSFTEALNRIRHVVRTWPSATEHLIEDKANGSASEDTLRGEIRGIRLVDPRGGKIVRANAAATVFFSMGSSGRVLVPSVDVRPDVKDYIRELRGFPRARYDDQVDQTTQALLHVHQHAGYMAGLRALSPRNR